MCTAVCCTGVHAPSPLDLTCVYFHLLTLHACTFTSGLFMPVVPSLQFQTIPTIVCQLVLIAQHRIRPVGPSTSPISSFIFCVLSCGKCRDDVYECVVVPPYRVWCPCSVYAVLYTGFATLLLHMYFIHQNTIQNTGQGRNQGGWQGVFFPNTSVT